jgi:pyruvate,water dikinase
VFPQRRWLSLSQSCCGALPQTKLKVWLKGADAESDADLSEITGFASSAGVVEGKARVLKLLKEIVDIEPGGNPSLCIYEPLMGSHIHQDKRSCYRYWWITSHAAIVCREYGIPSVTGTGIATTAIKTGDVLKVDGGTGEVTVLERA